MKEKYKNRFTNMEILRIIAMFMIIFFHICRHCINVQLLGGDSIVKISNDLFNNPFFYNRLLLLNCMMTWGTIGNAIFLLISGYFFVNSEKGININKISKKLLLQLGFASIFLVVFSTIIYKMHVTDSYINLIDINSFNSLSWFVGYYFLVILIAYLFLNKFLKKISREQYITFLIIILSLTQFGWTSQIINNLSNGLSILLTGILFYSLGGFIKKYNPFDKVKCFSILLIIILVTIFVYISSYNMTAINIENYLINPSNGFSQNILFFGNNNILVVILGVCIFELFRRIKMKNIGFINYIASGTFMVYLLHDNPLFYSLWGMIDWVSILYYDLPKFLIVLFLVGLLTFIFGFIVYLLYNLSSVIFSKCKYLFIKR